MYKKSTAFLYVNNEISEKEMKKTIPFAIATKEQNTWNKLKKGCEVPIC